VRRGDPRERSSAVVASSVETRASRYRVVDDKRRSAARGPLRSNNADGGRPPNTLGKRDGRDENRVGEKRERHANDSVATTHTLLL